MTTQAITKNERSFPRADFHQEWVDKQEAATQANQPKTWGQSFKSWTPYILGAASATVAVASAARLYNSYHKAPNTPEPVKPKVLQTSENPNFAQHGAQLNAVGLNVRPLHIINPLEPDNKDTFRQPGCGMHRWPWSIHQRPIHNHDALIANIAGNVVAKRNPINDLAAGFAENAAGFGGVVAQNEQQKNLLRGQDMAVDAAAAAALGAMMGMAAGGPIGAVVGVVGGGIIIGFAGPAMRGR